MTTAAAEVTNVAAKKKRAKRVPAGPKELFITYAIGTDENGDPDIESGTLELHRDSAEVLKLLEGGTRKYKIVTLQPPGARRREEVAG